MFILHPFSIPRDPPPHNHDFPLFRTAMSLPFMTVKVPQLHRGLQESGPGLADAFLPGMLTLQRRYRTEFHVTEITFGCQSLFFFLSLSVSGFCFKSPTLMWKRCPGTMCGQKAWQTHKENAQVKMGMLLHFSNEHVASSWYFMTLTQSKVHQYSLVISEYLCYSWQ